MTYSQPLEEFILENWNNKDKLNEKLSKFCFYDCSSDLIKGFMYHIGLNGYKLDLNEANTFYLIVLAQELNNKYALHCLGLQYYSDNNFNNAEEHWLSALAVDPKFKYSLYHLGLLYENQNNYKKAEEYYEKYIDINPNDEYVIDRLKKIKSRKEKEASNDNKVLKEKLNELEKSLKEIKEVICNRD